jgi:hypothetical protein
MGKINQASRVLQVKSMNKRQFLVNSINMYSSDICDGNVAYLCGFRL